MREPSKQNVAKSAGVVFVFSLAASILSCGCQMIFANHFGVSAQTDAFSLVLQISGMRFAIVTVSITTTVAPLYSKLLNKRLLCRVRKRHDYVSDFVGCLMKRHQSNLCDKDTGCQKIQDVNPFGIY